MTCLEFELRFEARHRVSKFLWFNHEVEWARVVMRMPEVTLYKDQICWSDFVP